MRSSPRETPFKHPQYFSQSLRFKTFYKPQKKPCCNRLTHNPPKNQPTRDWQDFLQKGENSWANQRILSNVFITIYLHALNILQKNWLFPELVFQDSVFFVLYIFQEVANQYKY